MERSAITPEQQDILAQVGMAVVVAQAAEQIIRLVMTYVIQGSEPLTLEYLQALNQKSGTRLLDFF